MNQRPCNCNRVSTGKYYKSTDCRMCWLFYYSPRHAEMWNKESGQTPQNQNIPLPTNSTRALPCIYLGPIKQRASCNCPLKFIHACEKHGQTVRGAYAPPDTMSCMTCPDYKPDSPFVD
jgi:hypothetical protein